MLAVSGIAMWLPLYALILWLVWRKGGWRSLLIFLILIALAIGIDDIIAGIFKHTGLLGGLLTNIEPRPRPMFAAALEGMEITPDSLRSLRSADMAHEWVVHTPKEAIAGLYGTISSHAATVVALAVFSCRVIRRHWFNILMIFCTLLICYSRIYLGKHYPMDILWGALLGAALGYAACRIMQNVKCKMQN
jgi:undecaprenyl-diphosphatase